MDLYRRKGWQRTMAHEIWHGIKRCCVFDTDIMLFSPVEHFLVAFGSHLAGSRSRANLISDVGVFTATCGPPAAFV